MRISEIKCTGLTEPDLVKKPGVILASVNI